MFLTIFLGLFSSLVYAQNCEPPKWVSPAEVTNGMYRGTLSVNCILKKSNADIRSINSGFKRKTIGSALSVHSGPIAETSRGLPAEKYDATIKEKDGTIRSIYIFASDERDLFNYDVKSQKISLSGLSGYLRKLDVNVNITRLNSSEVKLTLINTTHVAKPALAPSGIFLNMARKQSLEQFDVALKSLIQDINSL
jgi:hypothetical protein